MDSICVYILVRIENGFFLCLIVGIRIVRNTLYKVPGLFKRIQEFTLRVFSILILNL